MNNLGDQSISAGMQAMELPVREIKTKKPYTPKVKTVKQPVAFVPAQTARTKTNIPNHTSNKHDTTESRTLKKSLDTLNQYGTSMIDDYGRPAHIKHFTQQTITKGRARKALMQNGIETRKKTKKELKAELFDRMVLLQSMFIVFYCVYLFNKQSNLYALVAEYEAKPDLSQRALDDAMNAWSKPVVVHYDFPIIPITEENFDKIAKQKNLKALVKKYEIESRNNARKKQEDYINAMATEAYIKSYDAQLEEDYACWEVNRDMLNFFHNFWEKEAAEYEQMVMPKTIAYKQELIAATTPKTRKYKKKNPNKKKHDNFCLAAGRLPERRVPKKTHYKPALKQMRAMFNNAQTSIRNYSNPGHVM